MGCDQDKHGGKGNLKGSWFAKSRSIGVSTWDCTYLLALELHVTNGEKKEIKRKQISHKCRWKTNHWKLFITTTRTCTNS